MTLGMLKTQDFGKKLKRYEDFKAWNELEELALQQDKFEAFMKT